MRAPSNKKEYKTLHFGSLAPNRALVIETYDSVDVAWIRQRHPERREAERVPISAVPELYVLGPDAVAAEVIDDAFFVIDRSKAYKVVYAGIRVAAIDRQNTCLALSARNGARIS